MENDISNTIVPDCLENLAIKYICSNLAQTICKENEDANLELREGVRLPSKIAEQIFKHLLDSLKMEPYQKQPVSDKLVKYCKIFTDGSRCKLRRIVINKAPMSDDVVQVLVDLFCSHSLLEIDLDDSHDMNGNDNDLTPPYNHAILLPGFMLRYCSNTLHKITMHKTNFPYSINQIMMFSGKKAKVTKQDKYLTSDATLEHLPVCVSKENAPVLASLDIAESFTGWFLTIDPDNPPPVKILNLGGYHDIRINSMLKKILKQLINGEEDYNVPPGKRRSTIAHSTSEMKLHKYRFFKEIGQPHPMLANFLKAANMEEHLKEDDRVAEDSTQVPTSNFVLRQMNLLSMKNTLQHLGLYNTWLTLSDFRDVVFSLKGLRHLDVGWPAKQLSQSTRYRPSEITVWEILDRLPQLDSLDVSGTYYGEKLYDEAETIDGVKTLKFQGNRKPLDFLGLWGTSACKLKGLETLARNISGNNTEDQLIACLEMYLDRSEIVTNIMSKLSNIQQESALKRPNLTLKLLLKCAQYYSTSISVLFMCAANIYYLIQFQLSSFNVYQKRDILRTVTMIIERNIHTRDLVRSCLIIYFRFQLPGDILFDFDHIAKMILGIFDKQRDEADINTISGNLCNALVCSMDYDTKKDVRKHNYIGIMVDIIEGRIRSSTADNTLDTAWSALWNVTDETPENSEDIIAMGGVSLFKQCYEKFSTRNDLVRNMMGLMGNLAEVKYLRPKLVDKETLNIFVKLVGNADSTVEVAYNACGLLSNLLADDSDILHDADLDHIRSEMKKAILSWDIDVARNINYHTFAPLFTVLSVPKEPVTHLWVIWAIHNLCNRELKYVKLIIKDGGVGLIKLVRDTTKDKNTWYFADQIAKKCDQDEGSLV